MNGTKRRKNVTHSVSRRRKGPSANNAHRRLHEQPLLRMSFVRIKHDRRANLRHYRRPGIANRTRGLQRFHPDKWQERARQQPGRARTSSQFHMPSKNAAEPALLLLFKAGKTYRLVIAVIIARSPQ